MFFHKPISVFRKQAITDTGCRVITPEHFAVELSVKTKGTFHRLKGPTITQLFKSFMQTLNFIRRMKWSQLLLAQYFNKFNI